jgi:hypothetical protein
VESLNKSSISGSRSWDGRIINYVRIIFIIVIINDNYDINVTVIQRDSVRLGLSQ